MVNDYLRTCYNSQVMKNIHPQYHRVTVTCSCGATFETGSTLEEIHVDVCSQCHPFFTGEMKFVDTMGRIEKFQLKRQQAQKVASKKKKRQAKTTSTDQRPKTLKEMLQATKLN